MELVSSTPLLIDARRNGYAVVAFNVHTLEMLQAVVTTAEKARAPVILQTTVGTVKHLGADYIVAVARVAAKHAAVPIALHLDHCQDYTLILQCIQAGYTSVMIDASMHSFEENVRQTKMVVDVASKLGVNVEAELGKVGGVEDQIVVDERDATLADPAECAEFVRQTGVKTLAPAIGTAHGIYKGNPSIDFERLEQIAKHVSVPLVLHGGSGIPAAQVKRCIAQGMAKMNVATELKNGFSTAIKSFFEENPNSLDPRQYMVPAKAAAEAIALQKMEMCGAIGRA